MLKILILASAVNTGDMGNATQTIQALKHDIGANNIESIYIDASKDSTSISDSFSAEYKGDNLIIMAIGDSGAKALSIPQIKIDPKNSYVYWSGHQFTKGIDTLNVDQAVLPATAITKEQLADLKKRNIKVTTTFGVPTNNPSKDDIKKAYDSWEISQKPPLNDSYIVIMLPGDAPDVDGKMKYFTKDSATKLANDVEILWKATGHSKKIIIQNSPRTGKHNPLTNKVACDHEHKKDEEARVDEVSKFFTQLFDDKKIPYRFFNFTFKVDGEGKKPESVFNQLLYLVSNAKNSIFVMPGESVSLAGQLPLYIDPKNIIVFKPDSMNLGHEKMIDAGFKHGYFAIFQVDGSILYPDHAIIRKEDDATYAAKSLLEGFNKKFPRAK